MDKFIFVVWTNLFSFTTILTAGRYSDLWEIVSQRFRPGFLLGPFPKKYPLAIPYPPTYFYLSLKPRNMNTESLKKGDVGSLLNSQKLQRQISQAYNATAFTALVSIQGIDRNTGNPFSTDFIFDQNDPEFIAMLNDYGARKAMDAIYETEIPVDEMSPKDGVRVVIRQTKVMECAPYEAMRTGGVWVNALTGSPLTFVPKYYRLKKP